ncbi:unnamed protein product [Schistosoma turkestanicum]|nr:unnamed protein product [Schistosoma turkestanicum]
MKCVAKLMNFQSRSYEMAHQVLYILISHQVDCTMSLSRMLENLSVSLESLKNRLCSIMFEDFLNYYQHVETIPQDRDIFLEQMFVCGGLGYEKFIQLSVLNKFLSWQRPSGCFTISDSAVVKNRQRNVTFMSHKRKLLVERRHADGCLSHMTSVAAAVIGLYLRAFFFPTEYMDAYSFKVTPIVWKLLLVKSYTSLPKLIEDDDDDNKNNNIQTGISNQNIINSFSNRLILVKQPIYVPTGISFGLNYSTHFQNELKAINSEFLIFSILILCSICIFLYLLFRSLIVGCRFFDSSKPTLKI